MFNNGNLVVAVSISTRAAQHTCMNISAMLVGVHTSRWTRPIGATLAARRANTCLPRRKASALIKSTQRDDAISNIINVNDIANCRFEVFPGDARYALIDMVTMTHNSIDTNSIESAQKEYQSARLWFNYSHGSAVTSADNDAPTTVKPCLSEHGRYVIVASFNSCITDLLSHRDHCNDYDDDDDDDDGDDTYDKPQGKRQKDQKMVVERQPLFVAKAIADTLRIPMLVLLRPACSVATKAVVWYCYYYMPAQQIGTNADNVHVKL
jgi:hypothetical protein